MNVNGLQDPEGVDSGSVDSGSVDSGRSARPARPVRPVRPVSVGAPSPLRAGGARIGVGLPDGLCPGDQVERGLGSGQVGGGGGAALLVAAGLTQDLQRPGDQLHGLLEVLGVARAGVEDEGLVAILGLRLQEHSRPLGAMLGIVDGLGRVGGQDGGFHDGTQPRPGQRPRDRGDALVDLCRGCLGQGAGLGSDLTGHPDIQPTSLHQLPGQREPVPQVKTVRDQTGHSRLGHGEHGTELGRCELRHRWCAVPTHADQPFAALPGRTRIGQHGVPVRPLAGQPQPASLNPPLRVLVTRGLGQDRIRIQVIVVSRRLRSLQLIQRLHRGSLQTRVRRHAVPDAVTGLLEPEPRLQLLRTQVPRIQRRLQRLEHANDYKTAHRHFSVRGRACAQL